MVSIIVPVYKSEKTLRRCVESLCRQAYADIEILPVSYTHLTLPTTSRV